MRSRSKALLPALALLAACELQEVTTATPEDFVVAEVILEAGADSQFAYLHRGLGHGPVQVRDAQVQVIDEASGGVIEFRQIDDLRCIQESPQNVDLIGACFAAVTRALPIRAGAAYRLQIDLPGGRSLRGRTRVPGEVTMLQPRTAICALPPDTTLELRWRAASDAWVYDVEAQFKNIFPALVARGVVADTPNVPLRLDGLAITNSDTTLVLPSELGLFERFGADLHPILLAIRAGLPENVTAEVVVAAADRNYVNWARGGAFNPSGLVRIPSVRGDGTGVFGSFTSARFQFRVTRDAFLPSCFSP